MKYKITNLKNNCAKVHLKFNLETDNCFYLLCTSDRHLDSKYSDHKMQKKHLDFIKAKKGLVIDCGDLFDAMQGSGDKRAAKSELIAALNSNNYSGELVNYAYEFLKPYKENMLLIAKGNHELSFRNKKEIDLTENLVTRLNDNGSNCVAGGYFGFVQLHFEHLAGGKKQGFDIFYSHGKECGVVTAGITGTNRRKNMAQADIYLSGHNHNSFVKKDSVIKMTRNGIIKFKEISHINIPSYKKEWLELDNWHASKQMPSKPIGSYLIKFYVSTGSIIKYKIIEMN